MKKIILILSITIFLFACGKKENSKGKSAAIKTVKTQEFEAKEIVKTNVSSGVLTPVTENTVVSKTGGTVAKLNAKNGEFKKAGDVILVLEDQPTVSAYFSAKAAYNAANTNFSKMETLRKEKIISEDEILTKKSSFSLAESNYKVAKENYDNLNMTAKISGVVTDLNVKLYEKVNPNSQVFTVVDDKKFSITSQVSVEEINGVKVGNKAQLKIEGIPDVVFGAVTEVNPVADPNTKKYQVKIEVDNIDSQIKKGMYATVTVETGTKIGYLVPKSAVVVKDLFSYIYVNENGIAKEIKIERGYSNGEMQEVISPELTGKVEVVTDGQYLLEDKDKLNVQDENGNGTLDAEVQKNSENANKQKSGTKVRMK